MRHADRILVLHRGRIVYERYFGCLTETGKHAAMSVTKSLVGLLAQILVTEGALDETALVRTHDLHRGDQDRDPDDGEQVEHVRADDIAERHVGLPAQRGHDRRREFGRAIDGVTYVHNHSPLWGDDPKISLELVRTVGDIDSDDDGIPDGEETAWSADGGGDGQSWSDANNWSDDVEPDANTSAVFRDVDPGVGAIEGVELLDMAAVASITEAALGRRRAPRDPGRGAADPLPRRLALAVPRTSDARRYAIGAQ